LPLSYELSQNYPNPFNPDTKIKFTIPFAAIDEKVLVRLKIYDILGKEVATLVDEEKEPGIFKIEFSTIGLASGIYFYRIEAANSSASSGQSFVNTKKIILLR
jgi:hypothetical protein